MVVVVVMVLLKEADEQEAGTRHGSVAVVVMERPAELTPDGCTMLRRAIASLDSMRANNESKIASLALLLPGAGSYALWQRTEWMDAVWNCLARVSSTPLLSV